MQIRIDYIGSLQYYIHVRQPFLLKIKLHLHVLYVVVLRTGFPSSSASSTNISIESKNYDVQWQLKPSLLFGTRYLIATVQLFLSVCQIKDGFDKSWSRYRPINRLRGGSFLTHTWAQLRGNFSRCIWSLMPEEEMYFMCPICTPGAINPDSLIPSPEGGQNAFTLNRCADTNCQVEIRGWLLAY